MLDNKENSDPRSQRNQR